MLHIEILKNDLSMSDAEIYDFFGLFKDSLHDNMVQLKLAIYEKNLLLTKQFSHKQIASFNCINEHELSEKFKKIEFLSCDESKYEQIKELYNICWNEVQIIAESIRVFKNSMDTFKIK